MQIIRTADTESVDGDTRALPKNPKVLLQVAFNMKTRRHFQPELLPQAPLSRQAGCITASCSRADALTHLNLNQGAAMSLSESIQTFQYLRGRRGTESHWNFLFQRVLGVPNLGVVTTQPGEIGRYHFKGHGDITTVVTAPLACFFFQSLGIVLAPQTMPGKAWSQQ